MWVAGKGETPANNNVTRRLSPWTLHVSALPTASHSCCLLPPAKGSKGGSIHHIPIRTPNMPLQLPHNSAAAAAAAAAAALTG